MAELWLHRGYPVAAAPADVPTSREAVSRLLCQPGENKCVCSSYLSSGLLPAFYFVLCLPWVQPTVQTVNSKTIGTVSSISNTVAIPVSRASSQTRDQTRVSYISHTGRQITV